jgi:non-ribosomal peptide synthase protein (TIGR01720 family)
VLVDLERHGRHELPGGPDLSRTVGWFTTIHPVLLGVDVGQDPLASLAAVQGSLAACPDDGLPFGLARYLGADAALAASLAGLPPASILFNYLGRLDRALGADTGFRLLEQPIGPSRSPAGQRAHLLEINGGVSGGCLRLRWTWSAALHDRPTIAALADGFVTELRRLAGMRGPGGGDGRIGVGFGWSDEEIEDILSDIDPRS